MTIIDIHIGAERIITELIRTEHTAQGHYLTGAFENSLSAKTVRFAGAYSLQGLGFKYGLTVNEGLKPNQIKNSMLPGLVRYFILRGLPKQEAERAAMGTLVKWKKEGMSTESSKSFSSTGERQHFIERAFEKGETKIDSYFNSSFDYVVEEQYRKTKSEII